MVEVSNSKDDFEVFNQPQSPGVLVGDFSHLPLTQVSHTQEASIVLDAIVLQRKLVLLYHHWSSLIWHEEEGFPTMWDSPSQK